MRVASHQSSGQLRTFSEVDLLRLQSELSIIRFSVTGTMFTPKIKPLNKMPGHPITNIWKFIHGQAWTNDPNSKKMVFYLPEVLLRHNTDVGRDMMLKQISGLIIEHNFNQEAMDTQVELVDSMQSPWRNQNGMMAFAKQYLSNPAIAQYYADHIHAKQRLTMAMHRLVGLSSKNKVQINWIKIILNEMIVLSNQPEHSLELELTMLNQLSKINLPKTQVELDGYKSNPTSRLLPIVLFENRYLFNQFNRLYPNYRAPELLKPAPNWRRSWKNAA